MKSILLASPCWSLGNTGHAWHHLLSISKILAPFMSKSILPMLSSMNFIVPSLTFRSLIHFEFIFVCDVRECSNFTLSHGAV